jgi:hypothetical protein
MYCDEVESLYLVHQPCCSLAGPRHLHEALDLGGVIDAVVAQQDLELGDGDAHLPRFDAHQLGERELHRLGDVSLGEPRCLASSPKLSAEEAAGTMARYAAAGRRSQACLPGERASGRVADAPGLSPGEGR